MKGRTITNVNGAYANWHPLWRHTAKSPQEATMWMAQTTASGMIPWYHWLGGAPEDSRWRETGRKFFQWIAANEKHFVNRESIANLGVVFSGRTNGFYTPIGGTDSAEFLQGLYYALLEGRFLFDFVHEDDLGPATLKKYSALLLPNVAALSDAQCWQLSNYVQSGGSNIVAKLPALRIAERRDVRQQQRGIFLECRGSQIVFVHEVEQEASFQQCIVESLKKLGGIRASDRRVKSVGPPRKDDT